MAWIYLLVAACFEIGFTTFMKLGAGNWRSIWQLPFAICAVLSFVFLSYAVKSIPLGIAYAIWTGIGAVGTLAMGALLFGDRFSSLQIFFALNLIFSVIALKFTSS